MKKTIKCTSKRTALGLCLLVGISSSAIASADRSEFCSPTIDGEACRNQIYQLSSQVIKDVNLKIDSARDYTLRRNRISITSIRFEGLGADPLSNAPITVNLEVADNNNYEDRRWIKFCETTLESLKTMSESGWICDPKTSSVQTGHRRKSSLGIRAVGANPRAFQEERICRRNVYSHPLYIYSGPLESRRCTMQVRFNWEKFRERSKRGYLALDALELVGEDGKPVAKMRLRQTYSTPDTSYPGKTDASFSNKYPTWILPNSILLTRKAISFENDGGVDNDYLAGFACTTRDNHMQEEETCDKPIQAREL